ncbi:hypothetical protein L1987_29670 [Smallanthus sonchifolius]|uniref:Uncharacterized protein n=1 Tax=Smallanthus sonchifolius TaxID=185202 RepID=A0ACB9I0I6_9ASTR|nr:hypothetical protein L1987_29670 [Smallanthus sonchifolius]
MFSIEAHGKLQNATGVVRHSKSMDSPKSLCLRLSCSIVIIIISLLPHSTLSLCTSTPLIFNFGDSNSDTGGLVAGLGYSISSPYGRAFFGRSTGRLSDGRLLIDFSIMYVEFNFASHMESGTSVRS